MNKSAKNRDRISENGNVLRWDDARVFLAIARSGSLSGAAARLGVGLATASRQIARLEGALGLVLFSRHQNGYRLTDDGAALIERAETLERAANAFAEGSAAQSAVVGRVRLATAETLASHLIAPALPRLTARWPDLTLEIATDVRSVNLHRRDADLALRMVKPRRGNLTIRRLGRIGYGLYAAPAYLAARPEADRYITWAEEYAHLAAARWVAQALRHRAPVLATTTLSAQLYAAAAGLGVAVLPHFLAARYDLVCLHDDLGVDQDIWLAIHADLAQTRRVRIVAEFTSDLIRASRPVLEGPPDSQARHGGRNTWRRSDTD